MSQPKCEMCGSTNDLRHCPDCEVYLCSVCIKKYPERAKAILKDAKNNPRNFARKVGNAVKRRVMKIG